MTAVLHIVQVNNWDDAQARRRATRAFCAHLHRAENVDDRERCKCDSLFAKRLFAQVGQFRLEEELHPGDTSVVPIGSDVEFRIFEANEMFPRDKLVALTLPPPDQILPEEDRIDIDNVYRCTWFPW